MPCVLCLASCALRPASLFQTCLTARLYPRRPIAKSHFRPVSPSLHRPVAPSPRRTVAKSPSRSFAPSSRRSLAPSPPRSLVNTSSPTAPESEFTGLNKLYGPAPVGWGLPQFYKHDASTRLASGVGHPASGVRHEACGLRQTVRYVRIMIPQDAGCRPLTAYRLPLTADR